MRWLHLVQFLSCRKFILRKQYSSLQKAEIIASTSSLMLNSLKIDQLVVFIFTFRLTVSTKHSEIMQYQLQFGLYLINV